MVYWLVNLLNKLKDIDPVGLKGDKASVACGLCREIAGASHAGKNRLLFMRHGLTDVFDKFLAAPEVDVQLAVLGIFVQYAQDPRLRLQLGRDFGFSHMLINVMRSAYGRLQPAKDFGVVRGLADDEDEEEDEDDDEDGDEGDQGGHRGGGGAPAIKGMGKLNRAMTRLSALQAMGVNLDVYVESPGAGGGGQRKGAKRLKLGMNAVDGVGMMKGMAKGALRAHMDAKGSMRGTMRGLARPVETMEQRFANVHVRKGVAELMRAPPAPKSVYPTGALAKDSVFEAALNSPTMKDRSLWALSPSDQALFKPMMVPKETLEVVVLILQSLRELSEHPANLPDMVHHPQLFVGLIEVFSSERVGGDDFLELNVQAHTEAYTLLQKLMANETAAMHMVMNSSILFRFLYLTRFEVFGTFTQEWYRLLRALLSHETCAEAVFLTPIADLVMRMIVKQLLSLSKRLLPELEARRTRELKDIAAAAAAAKAEKAMKAGGRVLIKSKAEKNEEATDKLRKEDAAAKGAKGAAVDKAWEITEHRYQEFTIITELLAGIADAETMALGLEAADMTEDARQEYLDTDFWEEMVQHDVPKEEERKEARAGATERLMLRDVTATMRAEGMSGAEAAREALKTMRSGVFTTGRSLATGVGIVLPSRRASMKTVRTINAGATARTINAGATAATAANAFTAIDTARGARQGQAEAVVKAAAEAQLGLAQRAAMGQKAFGRLSVKDRDSIWTVLAVPGLTQSEIAPHLHAALVVTKCLTGSRQISQNPPKAVVATLLRCVSLEFNDVDDRQRLLHAKPLSDADKLTRAIWSEALEQLACLFLAETDVKTIIGSLEALVSSSRTISDHTVLLMLLLFKNWLPEYGFGVFKRITQWLVHLLGRRQLAVHSRLMTTAMVTGMLRMKLRTDTVSGRAVAALLLDQGLLRTYYTVFNPLARKPHRMEQDAKSRATLPLNMETLEWHGKLLDLLHLVVELTANHRDDAQKGLAMGFAANDDEGRDDAPLLAGVNSNGEAPSKQNPSEMATPQLAALLLSAMCRLRSLQVLTKHVPTTYQALRRNQSRLLALLRHMCVPESRAARVFLCSSNSFVEEASLTLVDMLGSATEGEDMEHCVYFLTVTAAYPGGMLPLLGEFAMMRMFVALHQLLEIGLRGRLEGRSIAWTKLDGKHGLWYVCDLFARIVYRALLATGCEGQLFTRDPFHCIRTCVLTAGTHLKTSLHDALTQDAHNIKLPTDLLSLCAVVWTLSTTEAGAQSAYRSNVILTLLELVEASCTRAQYIEAGGFTAQTVVCIFGLYVNVLRFVGTKIFGDSALLVQTERTLQAWLVFTFPLDANQYPPWPHDASYAKAPGQPVANAHRDSLFATSTLGGAKDAPQERTESADLEREAMSATGPEQVLVGLLDSQPRFLRPPSRAFGGTFRVSTIAEDEAEDGDVNEEDDERGEEEEEEEDKEKDEDEDEDEDDDDDEHLPSPLPPPPVPPRPAPPSQHNDIMTLILTLYFEIIQLLSPQQTVHDTSPDPAIHAVCLLRPLTPGIWRFMAAVAEPQADYHLPAGLKQIALATVSSLNALKRGKLVTSFTTRKPGGRRLPAGAALESVDAAGTKAKRTEEALMQLGQRFHHDRHAEISAMVTAHQGGHQLYAPEEQFNTVEWAEKVFLSMMLDEADPDAKVDANVITNADGADQV